MSWVWQRPYRISQGFRKILQRFMGFDIEQLLMEEILHQL